MIDKSRLVELRGLVEKATKGPWKQVLTWMTSDVLDGVEGADGHVANCEMDYDAALIVAAINTLPELLDTIEALQSRLAEAERIMAPFAHFASQYERAPLRYADDFAAIHMGTEFEAILRLSDLRAAQRFLAGRGEGGMSNVAKAKRTLLNIEIPRDELALRIAQPCLGMIAANGTDATQALDDMDALGGPVLMGHSFRRAADAAVKYIHECINAGRQPS